MILLQGVENDVCALSSVVDVAEDMQLVDGQSLDDVTDGYDEVVSASCGDNRIDNATNIGCLVYVISAFVHQFLDDIAKLLRKRLANL